MKKEELKQLIKEEVRSIINESSDINIITDIVRNTCKLVFEDYISDEIKDTDLLVHQLASQAANIVVKELLKAGIINESTNAVINENTDWDSFIEEVASKVEPGMDTKAVLPIMSSLLEKYNLRVPSWDKDAAQDWISDFYSALDEKLEEKGIVYNKGIYQSKEEVSNGLTEIKNILSEGVDKVRKGEEL